MSQPNDPPERPPIQTPPTQQPGESSNPFSAPTFEQPVPASPQKAASAMDGILPTNPLSAVSCYSGIIGLITCFGGIVLGPIAIFLGILGLKAWNVQESQYGKTMSSVRAWIGIITGTLGLIFGATAIAVLAFG